MLVFSVVVVLSFKGRRADGGHFTFLVLSAFSGLAALAGGSWSARLIMINFKLIAVNYISDGYLP